MAITRSIRVPDELDTWTESQTNTFRSYTSLVIEGLELLRAQRGHAKLEDKTRTGKLRK